MRTFPAALLIVMGCSITALAQETTPKPFQVCQGTYALCTFSQCGPAQGKGQQTSACSCNVWQGYSVGRECEKPKIVNGQTVIRSRYYPIPGYGTCSNSKAWAMCLDKKCVVDSNDKTRASCTCSVEGQGKQQDYLVTYGSACPAGIISSATVLDLNSITDFLKTKDEIPVQDFIVSPKK